MVDTNAFAVNVSEITGQVPANAALSNSQGTNKYDIYINDNGKVNSTLGDCYNFENSAYHESRHRYDSNTHGGTLGEVKAVLQETEHPSWSNVSMSYIHAQASYAANRLNEYLKKIRKEEEGNNNNGLDIKYYVNLLNKAFIGFASFSIEDNTVSVSNNIKNVEIVWPSKK